NARYIEPDQFPSLFDLATIDVSFISLTKILPAVQLCLAQNGQCIALIKPQFEVGKGEVGKGGIVCDPAQHRRVLIEITEAASTMGFAAASVIDSPILGADGNREFFIHLAMRAELNKLEHVRRQIESLTCR
ncbi:MAG TPA: SAM-dependent methyltransferase, partial [Blastocatellia bacterium]|nr:SAM-dependent methyltransferase [Blastocatellia bacterium]